MCRGVSRLPVFLDDADRERFFTCIEEGLDGARELLARVRSVYEARERMDWSGDLSRRRPDCGPYQAVANACNDDAPSGSGCYGLGASLLTVSLTAGETVRLLFDTPHSNSEGLYGSGIAAGGTFLVEVDTGPS